MAGSTFDINRIIDTDLRGELESGGTYTREQLLATMPEKHLANPYLIVIKDNQGADHYLKFQFDHDDNGNPTGVARSVIACNVLLASDRNPLGAASWWTGSNTFLPKERRRPADMIGFWNDWEFLNFLGSTLLNTDD